MWRTHSCPITDDLHDVFFLNASLGWIYTYGTGILLHTTNGGQTWSVQAEFSPIFLEQIQFLDANHGWICGEYGFVYKTTDGGKTWQDVSLSLPDRITEPFDREEAPDGNFVLLYAMRFLNNKQGFVAGASMNPAKKSRQAISYWTENSGKDWHAHTDPPNDLLLNTTFIDDEKGYALGSRTIFQTLNGGQDWEALYREEVPPEQFRGLYFLNEEIGWVCGFSGRVLKTINGGQTWDPVSVTKNRLRDIVFLDEQNGFVVGDATAEPSTLYQTVDGGESWQSVEVDMPNLHRLERVGNRVWAVGKEGTILSFEKDG